MKRITMKTLMAGPSGVLHVGETYERDNAEAAALVAGGFADYTREQLVEHDQEPEPDVDERSPEVGEDIETATADPPPERAVAPRQRGRRKG